eukprot:1155831-Pelagomonas_calceolata.AAC.2
MELRGLFPPAMKLASAKHGKHRVAPWVANPSSSVSRNGACCCTVTEAIRGRRMCSDNNFSVMLAASLCQKDGRTLFLSAAPLPCSAVRGPIHDVVFSYWMCCCSARKTGLFYLPAAPFNCVVTAEAQQNIQCLHLLVFL